MHKLACEMHVHVTLYFNKAVTIIYSVYWTEIFQQVLLKLLQTRTIS